jgi:predicted helicase
MFRNLSMPDEIVKQTFKLKDTRGWKFIKARRELAEDKKWDDYFAKILYRPFDVRHLYYTQKMVDWPRPEVMPHMMQDNLGLITPKQFKEEPGAFVTDTIIGHKTVSAYDINYLFPLYLYPDIDKKDLFSHKKESEGRQPNINLEFLKMLYEVYKKEPNTGRDFQLCLCSSLFYHLPNKICRVFKDGFPKSPFYKRLQTFRQGGKTRENSCRFAFA